VERGIGVFRQRAAGRSGEQGDGGVDDWLAHCDLSFWRRGVCRTRNRYSSPALKPLTADVSKPSGLLRNSCGRGRVFGRTASLLEQRRSRSDCRLQTAELRCGELQSPSVRVQNVLHDGKTQARSATSLVEADAALQHAREVDRFDAWAVIFDGNGWPASIDREAYASRGVASGVLD
jgi:hypothetical protein